MPTEMHAFEDLRIVPDIVACKNCGEVRERNDSGGQGECEKCGKPGVTSVYECGVCHEGIAGKVAAREHFKRHFEGLNYNEEKMAKAHGYTGDESMNHVQQLHADLEAGISGKDEAAALEAIQGMYGEAGIDPATGVYPMGKIEAAVKAGDWAGARAAYEEWIHPREDDARNNLEPYGSDYDRAIESRRMASSKTGVVSSRYKPRRRGSSGEMADERESGDYIGPAAARRQAEESKSVEALDVLKAAYLAEANMYQRATKMDAYILELEKAAGASLKKDSDDEPGSDFHLDSGLNPMGQRIIARWSRAIDELGKDVQPTARRMVSQAGPVAIRRLERSIGILEQILQELKTMLARENPGKNYGAASLRDDSEKVAKVEPRGTKNLRGSGYGPRAGIDYDVPNKFKPVPKVSIQVDATDPEDLEPEAKKLGVSMTIVNEVGPGGGNPVVELKGSADKVRQLLRENFGMGDDEIEELYGEELGATRLHDRPARGREPEE